jgi:hypothetical protein
VPGSDEHRDPSGLDRWLQPERVLAAVPQSSREVDKIHGEVVETPDQQHHGCKGHELTRDRINKPDDPHHAYPPRVRGNIV